MGDPNSETPKLTVEVKVDPALVEPYRERIALFEPMIPARFKPVFNLEPTSGRDGVINLTGGDLTYESRIRPQNPPEYLTYYFDAAVALGEGNLSTGNTWFSTEKIPFPTEIVRMNYTDGFVTDNGWHYEAGGKVKLPPPSLRRNLDEVTVGELLRPTVAPEGYQRTELRWTEDWGLEQRSPEAFTSGDLFLIWQQRAAKISQAGSPHADERWVDSIEKEIIRYPRGVQGGDGKNRVIVITRGPCWATRVETFEKVNSGSSS